MDKKYLSGSRILKGKTNMYKTNSQNQPIFYLISIG